MEIIALLLSLMCGLVLDTTGKNARKNFEPQPDLPELAGKRQGNTQDASKNA